jgi:CRISPR-associated exonuclease Cas4
VRALWVRSCRLGLVGQADVVEFEPIDTGQRVTPIEYKRGRPKRDNCDRVQLGAQAMCLEEMLGTTIAGGELFYGQQQRRTHVPLDAALRSAVEKTAARLHEMIDARETPPAIRAKKCDTCSLLNLCLPEVTQSSRSASRFVGRQFAAVLQDGVPRSDLFDTVPQSM